MAPGHMQQRRTVQESWTVLPPEEVLSRATAFFAKQNGVYAAFVDMEGPGFVTLRGQGGEEVVFAARREGAATRVTGSTFMFDQQVARFLSILPPAQEPAASASGAVAATASAPPVSAA